MTWIDELEAARRSGATGIVFTDNTLDRVHAPEHGPTLSFGYFLGHLLTGRGYRVGEYNPAFGLRDLVPRVPAEGSPFDGHQQRTPEQIIPIIDRIIRSTTERIAIVLNYADHLAPEAPGTNGLLAPVQSAMITACHTWANDENVKRAGHLIILLSHEGQVNRLLRTTTGFRVIAVPPPNEATRLAFSQFLDDLHQRGNTQFGEREADLAADRFAAISNGMRLSDIELLYRESASTGRPISRALVAERKAIAIRELAGGYLEIVEPTGGLETIAGLPTMKEELRSLAERFRAGDSSVPQGIILAGVPGNGKSSGVQALAYELGVPLLALRNVRGPLVGQSEENLERVLSTLKSLSPAVFWTDEIDQLIGQRSTQGSADGGTSERMFGRILEFFGSMRYRGQILWAATSNRPDLLDAAILDRIGFVLPVLHPTPTDVAALLPVVAEQLGYALDPSIDLIAIGAMPSLRYPSVRGLQEVVGKAADWAQRDAGRPVAIDAVHLVEAVRDAMPGHSLLQHEVIALTALDMCTRQSLLPWRSRTGVRPDATYPDYLDGLIDEHGYLIKPALQQRLRERKAELLSDRVMGGF